ncbi:MAG: iron ABC transporter permease [Sedimentisphaerales bacterium]|nr:iron ABC transporter permease [Sedimentisphaerales bacterium]
MGLPRSPGVWMGCDLGTELGRQGAVLTPMALVRRSSIAGLILIVAMCVALLVGPVRVSIWRAVASADSQDRLILSGVRIPRAMVAAITGAALSGAGVVCQVLLANPLADPYLLGVSSGAGLGAVLVGLTASGPTILGLSAMGLGAFAGALGALVLVWSVARQVYCLGQTGLILAGVVVNAFLSAVIMIVVALARSDQVYATLFWLIGNISEESMGLVWVAGLAVCVCLSGLFLISGRLNLFCFGQQQARLMGIHAQRIQWMAFGLAGLMTAVAVALAGLVGFVGLVVPHAIRLCLGPDCRQLLPISAIVGAAFLVLCDTLCRVVVSPAQLPVGVVTALVGGPVFVLMLLRRARGFRPI